MKLTLMNPLRLRAGRGVDRAFAENTPRSIAREQPTRTLAPGVTGSMPQSTWLRFARWTLHSAEVCAALDSKRVVGARLVGRSKTLRKQREMDWITTAVRPLDARQSREFIHRHAPSIQAHRTRHGHGGVKSKSERVVGNRDRLLFDQQLMALEFGACFLSQRLASGGPVVAKLLHPFHPDIVEM